MRDLRQVADKLKVVLLPLGQASQDSVLLKLRECKHLSHHRYSNSLDKADFRFLIIELDIFLIISSQSSPNASQSRLFFLVLIFPFLFVSLFLHILFCFFIYPFFCFYLGDLWGPLLVCLLLSSVLSFTAPGDSASLVFAAVFVIVWCGAAAVTVNAQLLGGSISFFQSICILGYCVFPLTISSISCLILSFIYKQVILIQIEY